MDNAGGLTVGRVLLGIRLTIAPALLSERLGEEAAALGERLAKAVHDATRSEKLGYYPALDYFYQRPGIDAELLLLANRTAAFVQDYVIQTVREHLAPVFSTVRVQRLQLAAATLPNVRMSQPDALEALARHYQPNAIKIELILTSLHKGPPPPGIEKVAAQKLKWWLRSPFGSIEITDARVVN